MFKLARVWLAHRRVPTMQSAITMRAPKNVPDYDMDSISTTICTQLPQLLLAPPPPPPPAIPMPPTPQSIPLPPMPPPPHRTWRRPPTPSTNVDVYCKKPRERWLKAVFDDEYSFL